MSRALITSIVFALFVSPVSGILAQEGLPRVPPAEVGLSEDGLERVTELMEAFVRDGKIAGAVSGVARGGRLAYLEAVGTQDLETRAPMTDASLFRIYSMSRTVTSVAAMVLWEEGRFDLDDPVSRYLPEFDRVRVAESPNDEGRPPVRPITVRDLMLFTSGISSRSSELYRELGVRSRSIPMAQFIRNVASAPLMEDPGTRYRYGVATTVLGGLIEVWSGQTLDVFLRERVFRPLAMNETSFWAEPNRADRLTTVYRQTDDGGLEPFEIEVVPFTQKPELLEGGIGLLSTVPDFLRFSQMLLNGGELDGFRLLEEETVAMITANGLSDEVLATRRGGSGWGLANVSVMLDPSSVGFPTAVGEYGWDGSAGTVFWINPSEDLVIVLMWQSSPANPESLRQQIKTLIHEAIAR